jgi:hypothetical protein
VRGKLLESAMTARANTVLRPVLNGEAFVVLFSLLNLRGSKFFFLIFDSQVKAYISAIERFKLFTELFFFALASETLPMTIWTVELVMVFTQFFIMKLCHAK